MPGFFGKQAIRLLREYGGWTADLLSQELFAMFGEDKPQTTDQPIVITRNADGQPAIKIIDNTGDGSPPITIIKQGDGATTQTTYNPNDYIPPQDRTGPPGANGTNGTNAVFLGAGSIPGRVASGGGSTYTVDIYENGPGDSATDQVSVTQLQIDPDSTIPAGTWVEVGFVELPPAGFTRAQYLAGQAPPGAAKQRVYSMQVPVWLSPP